MGSSWRCLSDRRCFGMPRESKLPRARGRRQGRRVDPQLRLTESGIAASIHRSAWKGRSRKSTYAFMNSPWLRSRLRTEPDLALEASLPRVVRVDKYIGSCKSDL